MNQPQPSTRYTYETVPLTPEEAQALRTERANALLAEARVLEERARELRDERALLIRSPLPTTRTVQRELHPGDEGYEDAPDHFDPARYQGNVTWLNPTQPLI